MASSSRSKKIIVACDGTWLNSDESKGNAPSNVTRFQRAVDPQPKGGPTQVASYYAGIGSGTSLWDHIVNGATGFSIGTNIREAYTFIRSNWVEGDEIYLLGFSRGAFTARSIATFIAAVGILNRKGMEESLNIYTDWENLNVPGYKNLKYPNKSFSADPEARYSEYSLQLQKDGLTTLDVPIKAVAVWDTVGALGVPMINNIKPERKYAFVNTYVPHCVENAFQALALDEQRSAFSPSVWELPELQDRLVPCNLKQVWFPGVHACIGGSQEDSELSCITLAWMIDQLVPFLKFDDDYLKWVKELNVEYYRAQGQPVRGWGMGYISDPTGGSLVGILEKLGGLQARSPGTYTETDPITGERTKKRLRATNETIHPSVRIRRAMKGTGLSDRHQYDPAALKEFTLADGHGEETDPFSEGWTWSKEDAESGGQVVITEEKLGGWEKALLQVSLNSVQA